MKALRLRFVFSVVLSFKVNSGILVIGDSLSTAAGKFGSTLHSFLSTKDPKSYVYALSASRVSHWTAETSNGLKISASYFGPEGNTPWVEVSQYTLWNLSRVLKGKEIQSLIVQLGTNHTPGNDLLRQYRVLIDYTCPRAIQRVLFILPPVNLGKNYAPFNEQAKKDLESYRPSHCPGIQIAAYDSWPLTSRLQKEHGGMRDNAHFWNSKIESGWLHEPDGVLAWLASIWGPPQPKKPRPSVRSPLINPQSL